MIWARIIGAYCEIGMGELPRLFQRLQIHDIEGKNGDQEVIVCETDGRVELAWVGVDARVRRLSCG